MHLPIYPSIGVAVVVLLAAVSCELHWTELLPEVYIYPSVRPVRGETFFRASRPANQSSSS